MTPNNGIPYIQMCNMDERTNEEKLRDNLIMKTKDKERFNRYCAEVMGYVVKSTYSNSNALNVVMPETLTSFPYYPHDDLNQLAPVVEKLINKKPNRDVLLQGEPIKQAFIGFVISTMPDKEN